MSTQPFAKLGAACGIIFPVGLFLTAGNGYRFWAVALSAIVIFFVFLAYLCSVLARAEGERGWLAQCAFAAGVVGIGLKLGSIAPEIAIRRGHIAVGTPLHAGLQGIADAATDVCLFPLGLMLAAVAVVAVRTGALSRSLAYGAGFTAIALVANGSYNLYVHSGFVPALLLFLLWTLLAGVSLSRRAWHAPAHAGPEPMLAV